MTGMQGDERKNMTPTQRVEILRASCCIAGADGETTDDEMQHLLKLANAVGVGDASLSAMIARSESDLEFYKQQFQILKAEPIECLQVLVDVSIANGTIKEPEFEVLKGLAVQLEIDDQVFRKTVTEALTKIQS